MINEVNKVIEYVNSNKKKYLETLLEKNGNNHIAEVKQAKKMLAKSEKRIAELDKLFTRLYEDNVSGKISDERFEMMSKNYEDEQKQLKANVEGLQSFVDSKEQQDSNINNFIELVGRYDKLTDITPEQMHELIDSIVVHAPDKASGHRRQTVDIHFRFGVASATVVVERQKKVA
ncbi:MAG: DUF4368 domain-containing protein [Ruminococcus sp.]|nr:DUF4368 domain-containing protein [Ruminococcus sp.]